MSEVRAECFFLLATPKKEGEIRVEIEIEFLFVFMALRGFYLGRRDEIAGYGGDRLMDAVPLLLLQIVPFLHPQPR